ncbi:MAG TPA: hypothetical protein VF303_01240 [Candidatus Nanoarchaeia archaeon]
MTFADYVSLSQTSGANFFDNFLPIFTNIVAAIIAIAIGAIVGWILKRVVEEISRILALERVLSGLPFYSTVVKSHKGLDVTTVVGEVVRWIAIIVFLIPAVTSLQISGANVAFSQIFAYASTVIIASLYLLFGFVVAWFIRRIVMAVSVIVGNNPARLIANIAYLAIIIYAAIQAILQLGITTDIIRLAVIAALAAAALAFGLAGKDTAADMVKRFVERTR